jgi:ABC-type multidrug transport system fused ATPase/permease subunit
VGFFMDGLDAEGYDRVYRDRDLVRRVAAYFRPHLAVMLSVAALVTVGSVLGIVLPLLIARGVDRLAAEGGAGAVGWLVAAILGAGVLGWTFNLVRQWFTARVVADVVLRLRLDAFRAVMARDLSFYDEYPSGKIVSRVTSDTDDFATVVTLTLDVASQILLVVLLAAILLATDLWLGLLALLIAPLVVAVALGFRRVARRALQRSQRSNAQVNSSVQEAMSGISVAKNFRRERAIYDEFRTVNDRAYAVNLRLGFVFSAIFPILLTVAGLGTTAMVYAGALRVLDGTLSAGQWFLFVQAIGIFWLPLTSVASFWSLFQQGLAASERVFALIDAEPRVVQAAADEPGRLAGRIELRDLDFRYTDQETVLTGFNLTIPAGQTVALVGHTGAGKSSLAKLIARFYEYQGGQLLIDGRDIRSFDLGAYRRQLGVIPQVPFLFSGSVADNIRYPKPTATDAEVEAVARRVGRGDWVDGLPDGLATAVGEQGRGLSLGQRQLIALARLLLQDPAIAVLDEATASVDPLTEAQIQEGLDVVLRDRTAIVIAHRLSTIRHADRIVVLERGRVVEDGDHDALMARGGHYAHLYNTYFRHQSPDYRPGEGYTAEAGTGVRGDGMIGIGGPATA